MRVIELRHLFDGVLDVDFVRMRYKFFSEPVASTLGFIDNFYEYLQLALYCFGVMQETIPLTQESASGGELHIISLCVEEG